MKLIKRLHDRLSAPSEELSELAKEVLAARRTKSTQEVYRIEWERFCRWANQTGHERYPVSVTVCGMYLLWLHAQGYSKSTIKRSVTVMRLAHDERDDPTGNRAIREILAGIKRRDRRPLRKAPPMTFGQLQAICEALTAEGGARCMRDRALISLGWVAALRASEIVALNWSDLSLKNAGLEVRIRDSKTNKDGEAEIVAIPYLRHEFKTVCPIRNISAIVVVDSPEINHPFDWKVETPVFTSEGKTYGPRINQKTIERALERGCRFAEINTRFTSHSLRRGFATFAAHRGITQYALMAHGRWKSSAVAEGYIEKAQLWTNNPIKDLLG